MRFQSMSGDVFVHRELPLNLFTEINFFRCVAFRESFYGRTLSELHAGNLRPNNQSNRYSNLFPGMKTSYWSDSPETAMAELKHHEKTKNTLSFWAYDDLTSTFPTLKNNEPIILINGEHYNLSTIISKSDNGQSLDDNDFLMLNRIIEANPDGLFYRSKVHPTGFNILLFEKGFSKLSLRRVRLRIAEEGHRTSNQVYCAMSCDYSPTPKNYGYCFLPIAKLSFCNEYLLSKEYKSREEIYHNSVNRMFVSKK